MLLLREKPPTLPPCDGGRKAGVHSAPELAPVAPRAGTAKTALDSPEEVPAPGQSCVPLAKPSPKEWKPRNYAPAALSKLKSNAPDCQQCTRLNACEAPNQDILTLKGFKGR